MENLNDLLHVRDASILLIEKRNDSRRIVAAPHHSPGGVKQLPCAEHEDSDENTGFIAREIGLALDLSSIVACNYMIDANKSLDTDYSKVIVQWRPKYLFEIHGHGAKRITGNEIEVSCGSKSKNEHSIKFALLLKEQFSAFSSLEKFEVRGDFESLRFRATKSMTITDRRWTAFHIELPPLLRIDERNNLPPASRDLISALTKTIEQF
jgi:hypothetical protein